MEFTKKMLLARFIPAMQSDSAALFVGAGLSRPAGFVDWRELMRQCAEAVGLDVKREHDLVAVAQYYLNQSLMSRAGINQIIVDELLKQGRMTANHSIIARLPISTIWTTNFDTLLEDAFRQAGRLIDVKTTDSQLSYTARDRETVIYKMHGDSARPDEVIICKEDYERYATKHKVFQDKLEGDLVSRNFLFLGFSFTDPNLQYMLAYLRTLLGVNQREHYAVMRRVQRNDYSPGADGQKDFEYDSVKQSLQVQDLQRYSVQTVLINEYSEVTTLLEEIESRYHQRTVFISGSAKDFQPPFDGDRMRSFCEELGVNVIDRDLNLVSGFGRGIGTHIIKGALERLFEHDRRPPVHQRLILRPFPRLDPSDPLRTSLQRSYREEMIAHAGFTIFIAGNRDGEPVAPGVIEEYEVTLQLKRIPIPLAVTGWAAAEIWRRIQPDRENVYRGRVSDELFNKLNDASLSNEQLLNVVFDIIERIRTQ
jgi:hypothetical protein